MLLKGAPGESDLQEEGTKKKCGKERCEPVHEEEREGEEASGPDPADDTGELLGPRAPAMRLSPPADETPEQGDGVVPARWISENTVHAQGCGED
jgi:hypothetical protein